MKLSLATVGCGPVRTRKTSIEWTEATWNPVTGCTKVSPGCKHCYAERVAGRLRAMGAAAYRNGFELTLQPEKLELPLTWRAPQTIFVNSMSDLFHEDVPTDYVRRVFDVMRRASWHRFQVLTKRAERLAELDAELVWAPNIWLGVSVESAAYGWRVECLRQTRASVRFLSLEPLLGSLEGLDLSGIHWVIVGGESGPGARPMEVAWARSVRDQCLRASVPFFFKQWGGVHKVPTLAEFETRFIEGHCRANRQKPSGIEGKLSVFRAHLVPRFGTKRLDEFTNEDIQSLKAHLASKKPKTVNNVLTTLSMVLKTAVEWDVIDEMPCRIRLLKVGNDVPGWYEFSEYERLVEAAAKIDPRMHLLVLLAGDAGLRRGEIIALRFTDVDFERGLVNVRRSMWSKFETEPKGFRSRVVPMTDVLAKALKAHRHLKGPRCSTATAGGSSPAVWCVTGSLRRSAARVSNRRGRSIAFVTRSARCSPQAQPRRRPSRSWPVTSTSPRP